VNGPFLGRVDKEPPEDRGANNSGLGPFAAFGRVVFGGFRPDTIGFFMLFGIVNRIYSSPSSGRAAGVGNSQPQTNFFNQHDPESP